MRWKSDQLHPQPVHSASLPEKHRIEFRSGHCSLIAEESSQSRYATAIAASLPKEHQ
ncbi:hypothetical protein TIFTF001_011302 [Ficus carica]|uniref:Uncharacterized protein n=1 Tax=Ficus carica TaxID=3494 RepID=A0AA88ADU8_FICCA|nr:hypothetical protein TIFTF001_011302 [Ficus carica]